MTPHHRSTRSIEEATHSLHECQPERWVVHEGPERFLRENGDAYYNGFVVVLNAGSVGGPADEGGIKF